MKIFNKIKKTYFYLFLFFLHSSLFLNLGVLYAEQSGFFWQISSEKSVVYILGSVHFFRKEIYPLNEKIEHAFKDSGVAVFEVNPSELFSIDTLNLFQQRGLYSEGSLKDHVSEKTYNILLSKIKAYGISQDLVIRFKPWFLALTLQSMELQRLGFLPEYGIDQYFFKKAEGKKIIGLETVQYQIEIFDDLPDKLQELILLYTIKEIDKMPTTIEQILRAWDSGNTEAIEEITYKSLKEEPELHLIYERLFFKRNLHMANKIEKFLNSENKFFVVVGVGHLVGEKGILRILQKKGFQVKKL